MRYGSTAYSIGLVIHNLPSVSGVFFLTEAHCKHRNVTAFVWIDMKLIPLTGKRGEGKFAMVDDEDYELVSKFSWCVNMKGYPVRGFSLNGKRPSQSMHQLIMGAPPGQKIDHWDMNTFNNQKHNLRRCTNSQNLMNRKATCKNKSGFKGVSWHKKASHYIAQIAVDGKKIHLGIFDTPQDASLAYQAAAKQLHGKFARW